MLVLLYNTLNAYRVTWFWQQVNTKLVNNPLTMQLSLAIMDALFWREREGNGTEDDLILAQWGGGGRERGKGMPFLSFFLSCVSFINKGFGGWSLCSNCT